MNLGRFPDGIPLPLMLIALVAIMLLLIEVGYRLGTHASGVRIKAQVSQVRAIMGASLGLLAFMLAFAFSAAQSHFETRTEGLLYETNVISETYRTTDLLEEPVRSEARGMLRSLVELRIETNVAAGEGELEAIAARIQESEQVHERLWGLATELNLAGSDEPGVAMFTASVLELMKTHRTRLEAAVYNRIPPVIWLTLLFMACLSMMTMGYQAGLTGARSRLATWTLAVAFSAVMLLIMDLDRPLMTLFDVNNQIMIDLNARMSADTQ